MSYNQSFWAKKPPSGLGGMSDKEERKRTYETVTEEFPDGRRVTTQKIIEEDRRESFISAANSTDYKAGIETYVASRAPIIAQTLPLNHLTYLKNEMMTEMVSKLQGPSSGNNVPHLKIAK